MTGKTIGAVEAGGTKFVLALADREGAILELQRIATAASARTLPEMADRFAQMAARHGPIGGFGIASFGPIGIDPHAPDYGQFLSTVKPGWKGANLVDALAGFHVPVMLDTDVNGAALAEARYGAGRGCGTVCYTTVGTGIGSGVVHRGQLLHGASHFETGHIRPPRDPARDPFAGVCHYHGDCCEGLASGPAIAARFGHDLSAASDQQIDLIAGYLADLACALIGFYRPDRLIFGGGVMRAPGLLERLRLRTGERLAGYLAGWDGSLDQRIVAPGLGDDAGITGAIELGRQILEDAQ